MSDDLPKAIAAGVLRIGDAALPCAVLDDEKNTRVLTQDGFLVAIGRSKRPNTSDTAVLEGMPAFLRSTNLKPFIDKNLDCSTNPIVFRPLRGGGHQGLALGYEADLLPAVCWIYHDAMRAGALRQNQHHIGMACEILLRGLTNVAINALVDEATGFQDMRARDALQKILDKYVSPEALPWVKMFDDEFYRLIFKLNGWPYDPMSVKRPSVIGHWTNDIYNRMAPGVKDELHRIVRRNKKGQPADKLHQHLNPDEGKPLLSSHLSGVMALMRAATNWKQFQRLLQRAYPKPGTNLSLPLDDDLADAL